MDFVIVLLFVMGAIAILSQKDTIIYTVGPKEIKLLHAYSEGEELREYLQTAAKFAFLQSAESAGAKTQADCLMQINSQTFKDDVNKNFITYADSHRSGEQQLGFKAFVGGSFQKPVLRAAANSIYITIYPGQQFAGVIDASLTPQFNLRYSIDPAAVTDINCDAYLKKYLVVK